MNSKFTFWTLMMAMFFIMSCSKEENQGGETPSNKNIPQVVLNEFSERYPNATNVVWTKKYDTYAVATFTLSNLRATSNVAEEHTAWFDWNTGEWGMTKTEIPLVTIPEAVKNSFHSSIYAENPWKVDNEVDYLQRQEGTETIYVISVEKKEAEKETEMKLYYTETGILIKEVADIDNDYDHHDYFPQTPSGTIQTWIDTKYPGAILIDTDHNAISTEVEFIYNGLKHEVLFNASYQWIYTRTNYERRNLNEIPELVISSLQKIYDITNEWKIDGAEKIESETDCYFCFEIERRNDNWEDEREVYFKSDGTFMEKQPELPNNGNGGIQIENNLATFIQQKYPESVIIGKEYDDGLLEINIRHNNLRKEVKFNGRQEWIKTEYQFYHYNELPETVKKTLESDLDFSLGHVEDIEVTETPANTTYEIEVVSERFEIQYVIDSLGKLLHKEYDN